MDRSMETSAGSQFETERKKDAAGIRAKIEQRDASLTFSAAKSTQVSQTGGQSRLMDRALVGMMRGITGKKR
jgi:hypothetical protein